jgi:altronate dehydratase
VAVYEYAEPVTAKGFVYMDTPGYDPVSATGQVAGGANMIVFTTGRGSAYGCAPAPSLKLSTNTPLWIKQEEISISTAGKSSTAPHRSTSSGNGCLPRCSPPRRA